MRQQRMGWDKNARGPRHNRGVFVSCCTCSGGCAQAYTCLGARVWRVRPSVDVLRGTNNSPLNLGTHTSNTHCGSKVHTTCGMCVCIHTGTEAYVPTCAHASCTCLCIFASVCICVLAIYASRWLCVSGSVSVSVYVYVRAHGRVRVRACTPTSR